MLRSILIGLVAGQRAMTPLAVIAAAARGGRLAKDMPAEGLLENPVVAAGTVALAASEMAGDKMKTAPDRILPVGILARSITAGYAGAALARPGERRLGAALAVATAFFASHVGFRLRMAALRRYGQTSTGFVEDAIVLAGGYAVANFGRPAARPA